MSARGTQSIDLSQPGDKVYRLAGICRNCGWKGGVYQVEGRTAPCMPLSCPICKCRTVGCGYAEANP
jgi:hypothetical protein